MQTSMHTAQLRIAGLDSSPASRGVRSALECIRGVAQVSVVPDEGCVCVTYDAFRVAPRQLETAVRVMGCDVERMAIALALDQVQYADACAELIDDRASTHL